MKEWTRPKNGTRALEAVFAIGVRQQSAYQRKTLFEKLKASHGVDACGQLHAAGRHLHDVRAAGRVEHVRAVEEAREGLTVLAVADEAEAAGGREFARNAAHVAAPTLKREIEGHACHIHAGDHEIRTANSLGLLSLERWRGLAEGRNRRTTDLEKMADWCLAVPAHRRLAKKPRGKPRGFCLIIV